MSNFLCIDIGTSSTKIAIVNLEGEVLGSSNQSYQTYYPTPGFVEQNPGEWWQAVKKGITEVLDQTKIDASSVACIGVAGQSWSNVGVRSNGDLTETLLSGQILVQKIFV